MLRVSPGLGPRTIINKIGNLQWCPFCWNSYLPTLWFSLPWMVSENPSNLIRLPPFLAWSVNDQSASTCTKRGNERRKSPFERTPQRTTLTSYYVVWSYSYPVLDLPIKWLAFDDETSTPYLNPGTFGPCNCPRVASRPLGTWYLLFAYVILSGRYWSIFV
jgi:hypothetical protein